MKSFGRKKFYSELYKLQLLLHGLIMGWLCEEIDKAILMKLSELLQLL